MTLKTNRKRKTRRLGVVMDPIAAINYKKDSTLAMLFEAQSRGYEIYYFEQNDLFMQNSIAKGYAKVLQVFKNPSKWFEFGKEEVISLSEFDIILMRKDPPFNERYIYTTYILEQAESMGVRVINRPQSLRDANEKLFTTVFPQWTTENLITSQSTLLHQFLNEVKDIVCKPLDSMGGVSIFRVKKNDVNTNVIFETLTQNGKVPIMAQKFIPEIEQGDKRILLINGEAVPFALVRVPQGNDWRGNLAVGAKGLIEPMNERDHLICEQIGPTLREKGLYFVGIDVIGEYLTEINVTSPTGIREIDAGTGMNISAFLFDVIESEF